MRPTYRFLFGPQAAVLLALGVVALGFLVPGYSQVRQTVSEIGEVGSPAQLLFTLLLCSVAGCILFFASGLYDLSRRAGRSTIPAWLTACAALSAAGVGIFSFPHPLHNVFGMSELVGYQAPLAFALAWRRAPGAGRVVRFSWLMFGLVWLAIALNLTSFDRHGPIWAAVRPFYGLIQRALFAAWFGWAAGLGWMFFRSEAARLDGG